MPRQKTFHKHLRTITTTGFAKTKNLPQAPANYHHHGFCQDKYLTTSTRELSPPRTLPRQKPYHKHRRTITTTGFAEHLRTITTTGFAKTKNFQQAPANYHRHGFCQDKNLTTSTCELSPPRVLPRQKTYHKHLRAITTTGFAKTETLPQAPANCHHHGFCQDKNLTTSTCELSPPRVVQRQKTYHKHLRTITTTGFAKTKNLPQAPANCHHHGICQPANYHQHGLCQDKKTYHNHLPTITTTGFSKTKKLTTSTCELSPPRVLPRPKFLTTSTCELSPQRVLPRQKPCHKHLQTVITTGLAKTKTLPQAPANYHHHGFCQDKNLTTSTCELSPSRVFAKTKKPTTSTCELSPPQVLARQKTLPQAPANYHHHGFCQDKNLTTSPCELSPPCVLSTFELSPPWVLPRQKPYHKHLRTITTTGFAKTKNLPQAPAIYPHRGFCQDQNPYHKHLRAITATGFAKTKNLTTSTCELSPPRVLPRQNLTTSTCELSPPRVLPRQNFTTSTCELSPPRVLPRQKPYHKHLRTITTTGFAKTKTLPQASANYHHHGFCQDKNLTTSTCELSPPRTLPRQKPYHKHLRTITPSRVLPRQKPYHKHLRTITTTGFAKTKTLPQAPANYHHHGFLPRQKPYHKHLRTITTTGFAQKACHKHLRTITTTGFAKTKTLPQAPANYYRRGFCQDKNLTISTCEL